MPKPRSNKSSRTKRKSKNVSKKDIFFQPNIEELPPQFQKLVEERIAYDKNELPPELAKLVLWARGTAVLQDARTARQINTSTSRKRLNYLLDFVNILQGDYKKNLGQWIGQNGSLSPEDNGKDAEPREQYENAAGVVIEFGRVANALYRLLQLLSYLKKAEYFGNVNALAEEIEDREDELSGEKSRQQLDDKSRSELNEDFEIFALLNRISADKSVDHIEEKIRDIKNGRKRQSRPKCMKVGFRKIRYVPYLASNLSGDFIAFRELKPYEAEGCSDLEDVIQNDSILVDAAKHQLQEAANLMLDGIQPRVFQKEGKFIFEYSVDCPFGIIATSFAELLTNKKLALTLCQVCGIQICDRNLSAKTCVSCKSRRRSFSTIERNPSEPDEPVVTFL